MCFDNPIIHQILQQVKENVFYPCFLYSLNMKLSKPYSITVIARYSKVQRTRNRQQFCEFFQDRLRVFDKLRRYNIILHVFP